MIFFREMPFFLKVTAKRDFFRLNRDFMIIFVNLR